MHDSHAPPLVFNPYDPEFNRDPHPILKRFRDEQPIYYFEPAKGFIFFRYRDVISLLRDPRFATDPSLGSGLPPELRAAFPDFASLRENDLFMISPSAHARIRRLINPVFGPRGVEAHRERVTAIISSILWALPEHGRINFFADVARTYPSRVIAAILNIPAGFEPEFIAFGEAIIATILMPGMPPEQFASFMPAVSRGMEIVRQVLAERRSSPMQNDLLSELIAACDEGDKLTDGELLSLIAGLLVGGSDTTVHLTTYAMLELLRHPSELALVRSEPQLIRQALDETLRYNSFSGGAGLARFASEDFTYEGVQIRRGQPLFLNVLAAWRDPECVADGDVFDVRRRTNSSPWFGLGPHFCIGASLARMEASIVLEMFLSRYPQIELAGEPVYGTHPVLRDIIDLPLRVSTGQVLRTAPSGSQK